MHKICVIGGKGVPSAQPRPLAVQEPSGDVQLTASDFSWTSSLLPWRQEAPARATMLASHEPGSGLPAEQPSRGGSALNTGALGVCARHSDQSFSHWFDLHISLLLYRILSLSLSPLLYLHYQIVFVDHTTITFHLTLLAPFVCQLLFWLSFSQVSKSS